MTISFSPDRNLRATPSVRMAGTAALGDTCSYRNTRDGNVLSQFRMKRLTTPPMHVMREAAHGQEHVRTLACHHAHPMLVAKRLGREAHRPRPHTPGPVHPNVLHP